MPETLRGLCLTRPAGTAAPPAALQRAVTPPAALGISTGTRATAGGSFLTRQSKFRQQGLCWKDEGFSLPATHSALQTRGPGQSTTEGKAAAQHHEGWDK